MDRAEVTDLYAWMEYQFRIIATNEYGSGEASIPSLKIKTWDSRKKRTLTSTVRCLFSFIVNDLSSSSAPVISPTDVAGYGGRNGEIVITWNVRDPRL